MLGQLNIELIGAATKTGDDEVLLPLNGSKKYNATLGGTLAIDRTGMIGSTDASMPWILKNDTADTLSGTFSNYANEAALSNHNGRDGYR
jgi:hypothetical protein